MKSLLRIVALPLIFSTVYVSKDAAAVEWCRGTCTVQCNSGPTYTYPDTPANRCCEKESVCPGMSGNTVQWYPNYSWECSEAFAFVCPFEPF